MLNRTTGLRQDKLFGLDHLRAIAIILVLCYHYDGGIFGHPGWMQPFGIFGWTGVDLFFVLSGFLISSQLFDQLKKGRSISLKTFFLKRFFRIIPIYLFIVAVYFLFPGFHEKEKLSPLWRFLTFTKNFGLDNKTEGTFSHSWSLCVEEHFYFSLPLILMALLQLKIFKRSYWLLILFFIAGFACRIYSWYYWYLPAQSADEYGSAWTKFIYYPTYNRLDGLLAGVAVAAVYQYLPNTWRSIAKYGNHLIVTSLALLTLCYFYFCDAGTFSNSIFGFPVVSVAYGLLVAGAVSPQSFLFKWQSKTTTLIATLSYAVYLSHKGIIHVAQTQLVKTGIDRNGNLMLLICIFLCLLGALLLHHSIEKPFMRMRDRVLKKPAPDAIAIPPAPVQLS